MPAYRTVLYEIADSICTITLNRPQQRNAQSTELLTELDQAIMAAGADPAVRVILLTGAGDHFSAGHDIECMFTTPKLLEAFALRLEKDGTTIRKAGITGIFGGGTEFTPQWNRFAHEELLDGAYLTPTYGNTLMGLAAGAPTGPFNNYKVAYYAPQPRAVVQVVDFDDASTMVGIGETGRVRLTTLTREFFVPGFLERDEGEREAPLEKFPWDGVSGVRPYRGVASSTTVGVY